MSQVQKEKSNLLIPASKISVALFQGALHCSSSTCRSGQVAMDCAAGGARTTVVFYSHTILPIADQRRKIIPHESAMYY
jgi:hypothetical protein